MSAMCDIRATQLCVICELCVIEVKTQSPSALGAKGQGTAKGQASLEADCLDREILLS